MMRHPLVKSPAGHPAARRFVQNHPPTWNQRFGIGEVESKPIQGEFAREPELARVEAALFLADEPLTARKLALAAGLPEAAQARQCIARLRDLYTAEGSAFQIEELAGGFQLLTRPEFHPWLTRLRQHPNEPQLSSAARETLTIIAYRQPITRADIEAIRGVGSSEVLKQLMEKGLARLAGRDDSLGRPALYETTRKFLQVFGLKSLKDLPPGEGLFPEKAAKPLSE